MKNFKHYLLLLGLVSTVLIVSCSDEKDAAIIDDENLVVETMSAEEKMELYTPSGVVASRAPGDITYAGELCGDDITATHATVGSINNTLFWDYYSFSGDAGDVVTIVVNRIDPGMDPAMTLYSGTTDDSTLPGLTALIGADDNISNPSCFGDPGIFGYVLPATGDYTLAVYDFISCGTPLTYEIVMEGISCDRDGDGVPDDEDNCPDDANADQANYDGDAEGDVCDDDDDNDGCLDVDDDHPMSNQEATVSIGGCDSGVANVLVNCGSTMSDIIDDCAANAVNHVAFVRCVTLAARGWRSDGLISSRDMRAITRCANSSSLPN